MTEYARADKVHEASGEREYKQISDEREIILTTSANFKTTSQKHNAEQHRNRLASSLHTACNYDMLSLSSKPISIDRVARCATSSRMSVGSYLALEQRHECFTARIYWSNLMRKLASISLVSRQPWAPPKATKNAQLESLRPHEFRRRHRAQRDQECLYAAIRRANQS